MLTDADVQTWSYSSVTNNVCTCVCKTVSAFSVVVFCFLTILGLASIHNGYF